MLVHLARCLCPVRQCQEPLSNIKNSARAPAASSRSPATSLAKSNRVSCTALTPGRVLQVMKDRGSVIGLVDFATYEDMANAIRKLDSSEFKNPFDRCTIRVKEERGGGGGGGGGSRGRSRSRSPRSRSRSRSRSR